jgi:GNAT superfamily N-acetyltransferase
MTYTIQEVDITDAGIDLELRELYRVAFGSSEVGTPGYLHKNTKTNASKPTFFLAAIENGKIIGANGFIAFDFFIKDKTYTCYQSCWSATHPDHQGRKIFVNMINYAKDYLKSQGAGFLFGVPNDKSYPIFMKKLGFTEVPAMLARVPNIPFIKNSFFNRQATAISEIEKLKDNTLFVKEEQIVDLKKNEHPELVEVVRVNDSFCWGKLTTAKKFGIKMKYFYLGGVSLKDPNDYKRLINKIFSQYGVLIVQIVSEESNTWNRMITKWEKARFNGFIYFDLNAGLDKIPNINMMYGIIDVF